MQESNCEPWNSNPIPEQDSTDAARNGGWSDRRTVSLATGSGNWTVLEILGHLLAEETSDFCQRVRLTLKDAALPWPPIDPEGIVVSGRFNEQVPATVLHEFHDARAKSIDWLKSLVRPAWDHTHHHPSLGPLRAGDLLLSWVAHDQLHIRQIAKRCFEMIRIDGQPFRTQYAGDWGS